MYITPYYFFYIVGYPAKSNIYRELKILYNHPDCLGGETILMKRINKLSDLVVAHIAAGEVVERTVSVVKELVENSIDAGADRIYIYLEDGGKRKVMVSDNGHGVHRDDLLVAFERHATSKIERIEDIFESDSLGFRGEALASISTVSRVTMETSTGEDRGIGTRVVVEGGKTVEDPNLIGRPKGTSVMVENLFFNIPARRKFLKSGRSELAAISDYISQVALIHPQIAFSLEQSGKTYLQTSGKGDPLQCFSSIYGHELARRMIRIEYQGEVVSINGLVSDVDGAKKTRKHQTLSINGRPIRNPDLYDSIERAARNFIPPGLHPVLVLNLQISPDRLDCNSHPRKETVKLFEEQRILDEIFQAVLHSMRGDREELSLPNNIKDDLSFNTSPSPTYKIEIIGQLKKMYILCEVNEKLIIVDQHAAHEAILYHYLKESVLNKRQELPLTTLKSPIIVHLTPSQLALFETHKDELSYFGFQVEPFGSDSMIVREVPVGIDIEELENILSQILSDGMDDYNDWLKHALISTSCKSAIKAYEELDDETMEFIVREITLNQITNCPHGRPIFTSTPVTELHKKFKRIL